MPRVASLYLPNLATDRIRRKQRQSVPPPESSPALSGKDQVSWWPDARWPENTKERAQLLALRERMAADQSSNQPAIGDDHRYGGWRPGAHWARQAGSDEWLERRIAGKRAKKAALLAEIEQLPLHQRPPMRELGRRSENLPHPFRAMPSDEAGSPVARPAYDLEGAFWQQGRTLGGFVAREVAAKSAPASAGGGDQPLRVLAKAGAQDELRLAAQRGGGAQAQRAEGSGFASAAPPPRFARSLSPAKAGEEPLVTAHRAGQRVVIAAACPRARAIGLGPGMPLTQARALVPGLDVRPADPDGDAADLQRLERHAARHWTPLVTILPAAIGDGGLWLDITASAHLFGGEERFARRVLGLCRRLGLAARIAIADTAAAAYALARSAAEPLTLCPPGGEAEAIARLPLSALRLDPAAVDQARRLGVDTVGALAALPRAPLVRRFGKALVARLDEALGARPQPLDQVVPPQAPSVMRRYPEPMLTAEPIAHALGGLIRELAERLASAHLGARTVALILTRVDSVRQRLVVALARPSRDPDHLERLLAARIERIEPGFGIEAMTLVAEWIEPLTPQSIASPLAGREAAADLALLIDRLALRLGRRRLHRIGAVESDVPERGVRRIDPLDTSAQGWEPWPRPVRLLDPPEPVEGVVALLPDGVPKRFTWRGRAYAVVHGDGPERIHGEWWRRAAERDSVRDYFQVEDRNGARFWLFRRGDAVDARTGDLSWRLHGLFA